MGLTLGYLPYGKVICPPVFNLTPNSAVLGAISETPFLLAIVY